MGQAKKIFCGPPGIELNQIFGTKKASNVYSHFKGRNVVYVHKGRTAIRLACTILGLGPDNEVLAPAYNCGSEVDALLSSGTSVVLYRIGKSSAIDVNDLEDKITPRTKAIYITHYFGFPQSMAKIAEICERKGLYLVEDCALALFSKNGTGVLGTIADISIFSLTKTLPVPDGGILLINNDRLQNKNLILSKPEDAQILRAMLPGLKAGTLRWLSRTPLYPLCKLFLEWNGMAAKAVDEKNVQCKPDIPASYYYNEKMSEKEMSPLTKYMLRAFDPEYIVAKRRKNFKTLLHTLSQYEYVKPLLKKLPEGVCPLNFPIVTDGRDQIRSRLNERGIDAWAWWKGYHHGLAWEKFPDACFLKDHVLTLPVHQDLDEREVNYMAETVGEIFRSL